MAKFRITGTSHVPQQPGRPEQRPSVEEIQLVLDGYERAPQGVARVAMNLRVNHDISYQKVYRIMKDNGLVISSTAKSRKRKWVRFERKHSNSLWHTDWHSMKDPRMKGLNLVTFLDDASRCVTGVGLFTEATSENVVDVLIDAIAKFGTPAAILSDNGSCFVGAGGGHSKGMRSGPPLNTGMWPGSPYDLYGHSHAILISRNKLGPLRHTIICLVIYRYHCRILFAPTTSNNMMYENGKVVSRK